VRAHSYHMPVRRTPYFDFCVIVEVSPYLR